uniref:Uncharacterized protein n=1 Tax=Branchiostoma floridae TaxID=7739 RepID=C3YAR6_BRAFL|eukprot:XP_002606804.1 hypothetical protein BRAFLDRAFT_82443 [Branchiostoma floridae]
MSLLRWGEAGGELVLREGRWGKANGELVLREGRWGADDRELVLREGRYVVEVLKRRNRLLPVTVFSTLAERMVQHGFVWTDSRLVEGDVDHVFKMENTEKDSSSPSSPYGPPVEFGRRHAEFALARRRVSSTKLVDAIACGPWPGQYPGSSPEGSDDELTSFIDGARTDSREEKEMVTQLGRNLKGDASGSFRSGFVSHGFPGDAAHVDMPAFVMEQPEIEHQEEVSQTVRAGAHEETASGVWVLSPEEVLDSNIPSSEVGSVPVLEEGEDEELLRKMLTAHRQGGRMSGSPAVLENTEPTFDVITSIAQEEAEEEEAMKLMTSSPGIPFIPYDQTLKGHDVKLKEDMPIIIQEAGCAIPELCWTNPEEQVLSIPQWLTKQEEKSPSFLTQLLTEHQSLHREHEISQTAIPETDSLYSEEAGAVSPTQLLEEPPPAIVSTVHSEMPAAATDSTDGFMDLLECAEDSHDLISEECDTKRRRMEDTWATVKRVDLVEARTAPGASSPYTDGYRQLQSADRQPAIAPTAAYKLVEELLENAARTRQCDEVSNIVTDNSDTVADDDGVSPQLISSTVLREDKQASYRHCDEVPSVFVNSSHILAGDGDFSPQLSSVHQQFHEEIQAPHPAIATEFALRSPCLQPPPPAVRSTKGSPEGDLSSERVTVIPSAELLTAIAELVGDMTGSGIQPDPKNVSNNQVHTHIAIAVEEEDALCCHGDQVSWDHPPDFSTLRAIWMEDWPVEHRAEHVSENLS